MNFLKKNSFFLSLITLLLLFRLFSLYTEQLLCYQRSCIEDGELWRLVSAHLVHGSWEHLWLNLFALIIVWILFKDFISSSLWWLYTFISAVGISVSLYFFMGSLEWYMGFSGVLHSMFVFGAIAGLLRGRKEFIFLFFFVIIKILFEQLYGSSSTDLLENIVIVNAHMYGAIIGFIIGGGLFFIQKRLIKSNQD